MDYFKTYRDTLRLVRGNDFATIHNIVAKYPDDTEVEGFDLDVCTDLVVRIKRDNGNFKDIETYAERWFILEPKKIRINFDGLKMKNGSYRIEFFGKFQGKDWRCYSAEKGFGIVESNEEANIPAETIIADGVYQILTDFTMTYQTQEQADWEETDDTLPSYIKNKPELFSGDYDDLENKPDLSVYVEKVDGKGLSENDYTDEDRQKVANAVTRTVADLANYYLKSETYTQNEVNELIASTENFHYEIYPNISYIASPLSNVLYLIGPTGSGSDRYEEYVYSNDAFVKIGDTSIDLSGYVTSFELSEALTGYVLQSSLSSILSDYQEKLFSGINIKTINEQSILGEGNIEIQSGEDNVIEVVKVNNVALTPDENKAVNVSVPTALSQLNEDTTHRTVTDTEKSTWNGKQDAISDLATIRSGAAAGATALQPAALSGYQPLIDNANKLDYSLLDNTPTIPAAQVNSDWNANSGVAQILNKPAIPAAQVQSDWSEADTGSKAYIQNKPTIPAAQVQSDWNEADNTKADYIKNKPTIPAAQVQSDWNEADNTKADYIKNKPTIPSVVDSLNSASTTSALSANQGKVLDESKQDKIDNSHKLSADLVDDDNTTNKFVTDSDKTAWSGKQDALVSGTNIKTINGSSVLGSGNLSTLMPVTNHGTSDTTYSVTPNTLHIWGEVASLTLTLATPTDNTIVNEYMIEFTSGSTATTLSLPSSVEWAESCGALSVEASKTYQISIVNNISLWASISNS